MPHITSAERKTYKTMANYGINSFYFAQADHAGKIYCKSDLKICRTIIKIVIFENERVKDGAKISQHGYVYNLWAA
jgi:hypothetical protein